MRGNGHKLEHGKLPLDIKKNISHEDDKKWEKGDGILEILKALLDKLLTNLTSWTCLEQKCGSETSRGVFLPKICYDSGQSFQSLSVSP